MGSAALWQLAARGATCLGLEQFQPGHDRGSSHGETRIIRLAYAEHPSYVPLLRRAYELWGELEARSGRRLLHITGSIDGGLEHMESFAGALRSAQEHGLPHEVLSGEEVNRRFPGYSFPNHFKGVYQPQGGLLESEAAIKAHVQLALAEGAEVELSTPTKSWAVLPDGRVEIETAQGAVRARRLVLAAGAWMPQLVPELRACAPERQVVAWFRIKDSAATFQPGAFPVFNIEDDTGRWYGFPQFGGPGFKIGRYRHRGEATTGDGLDRAVHQEDLDLLWRGASANFRGAERDTHRASACMFTNTPDGHFVLDLHPDHPQVVLCSACSGHGYKFASVIGEVLADLATTGATAHDISLHRLFHPGRTGKASLWRAGAA